MQPDTDWATRSQLVRELRNLGVTAGDTLMVHSSMQAIGPVLGGPNTVIQALVDALSPAGTLMMYVGWDCAPTEILTWPPEVQALCYAEYPGYDPQTARAVRDHGILVEAFRTWPGVLRSAHPDCSMAALGAQAAWLTSDHPFNYGYGNGSPLHKLCMLNGSVLLLGAPLDTLTILHYAEDQAKLPGKRIKRYQCPVQSAIGTVWIDMEEFETGDSVIEADYSFDVIAQAYVATGKGRSGRIGRAQAYLFSAADLVQFGVTWLETHFGVSAG